MAHRVELIVDDAPYEALESIARRRGRSVAEIVADLVMQHLGSGRPAAERSLADIEGIVDDPGASALDLDAVIYGAGKHA